VLFCFKNLLYNLFGGEATMPTQTELLENWELAVKKQDLFSIAPLR
jgi:hypothetical protein